MLKKLLNGEYSLKETFWKFGILGIFVFRSIAQIFEYLVEKQLNRLSISDYFLHHFVPVNPNAMAMIWTLCYLFFTGFFIYYAVIEVIGTWRSSASFERSNLLKQIIRMIMLLYVSICVLTLKNIL